MNFDHILLIGFGGPTKPEEVRPFLENVTRGIPIPEARLKEVEHHYAAVGGASPYYEYTRRLFDKLQKELQEKGLKLPIFLAMRNWHPLLKDTIAEIKAQGLKQGIGVILAPHRSEASYDKYIRNVEEANSSGARLIEYHYLNPWHDHPGFIEAQAEELEKVLKQAGDIPVIFTAHSIPVAMAEKSQYAQEVVTSSEQVARKLGLMKWQIAWQSRSGSPTQPWLEPDVLSAVRDLKARGEKAAVLVPIGFLCDNVEVLYDLDIEAKQEAEKLGMQYFRASTVMDHPKFVSLFAGFIQELCAGSQCR